jgi:N-carbamoyl-L-amino-acid hydrolase
MDEAVVRKLAAAADRIGLKTELLPSGAGHDAAVFANAGVPSGMIFVRNANGSHNPDEAMDIDDFMHGVDVLYAAAADRA